MAIGLEQFVKSVSDSGILSGQEMDAVRSRMASQSLEVQDFARELVNQGKLTIFQARNIVAGGANRLVLGSYVILDKLGAGGMGTVYKAQHRRMKRVVALKVLPTAKMSKPGMVQRFQREVEAAAKLDHPNVVTAHDADEHRGLHYLVMEYVDGFDLAYLVERCGRLPGESVDWIVQVAKGLNYAHSQGVVHRDIKPANLLLDTNGTVKILDMGLARFDEQADGSEDEASGLTQMGEIIGTLDFMSPEQAEDTRRADARSDIYSLGCTLYYLLTAQYLYSEDTVLKKLLAHRTKPIPSLRSVCSDVSEPLDLFFQKMVAKSPDDRPQTMGAVIEELQAARLQDSAGSQNSQEIEKLLAPLEEEKRNEGQKRAQRETEQMMRTKPVTTPVTVKQPQKNATDVNELIQGVEIDARGAKNTDAQRRDSRRQVESGRSTSRDSDTTTLSLVLACKCGAVFAAPGKLAGKILSCPSCSGKIPIPDPQKRIAGEYAEVRCPCGERFFATGGAFGKTLKCKKCRKPVSIPNPKSRAVSCKKCGQRFAASDSLAGKTVACPSCSGAIKVPPL
ncbi:MAG: serine/threonine protein kinase [Pirellulales bacterium]|nr:serine/threonine protein kinase [Pirellulales bacterium]